MQHSWIWLPEEQYPDRQATCYSAMAENTHETGHFSVARFSADYRFSVPVHMIRLQVSGDTAFRLWANGTLLCCGPATPGGDFLDNDKPRPRHYATQIVVDRNGRVGYESGGTVEWLTAAAPTPLGDTLSLVAEVRMMPVRICEYSKGHGGFLLDGIVTDTGGDTHPIGTDGTWQVQYLGAYVENDRYDGRIAPDAPIPASPTADIWHADTAPIPPCITKLILPPQGQAIFVPAQQTVETTIPLPMIYAGYLYAACRSAGPLTVCVRLVETDGDDGTTQALTLTEGETYLGFDLQSAGLLQAKITNAGDTPASLDLGFLTSHYPVAVQADTETSDEELNAVLRTCAHTLQYCRQTHHLDSPRHCEPLACTGDYYIETMMTAFTFGDLRLAAFDVRRTAELLRHRDGRMFHTSYSLIWVRMLWDTYYFTGETALLTDCEDALDLLLHRFSTYLGSDGIIETPPDYMFVDWLNPDGISLHHPPKALGQTCLNMFYFGALQYAAKTYTVLGQPGKAEHCKKAAAELHTAILELLWDPARELFFEGLNTPTPPELLYWYMPENVEKRYYRMHANILAAYVGFFPEEENRALLRRILNDPTLGEVQPYFLHYLLEAVYRNGLREEYTLPLLEQWKAPVRECPKGLAEGFCKPEPTYRFDHSHAWGGTPCYALPLALSGLELTQPGFARIRLSPSLLSLESATVRIPAPQGIITLHMERGKDPEISLPAGIKLEE